MIPEIVFDARNRQTFYFKASGFDSGKLFWFQKSSILKLQFFFQTCSIDMAMGSLDANTVNLVPDQLKMIQKLNMPIFLIVDWGWQTKTSEDGEKGISVRM